MKKSALEFLQLLEPSVHEATLEIQPICNELVDSMTERLYGDLYQREMLTLRERILVTIAGLMAAGNAKPQLMGQLRIALNNGITRDELMEVAQQISLFSGFANAINAMILIEVSTTEVGRNP